MLNKPHEGPSDLLELLEQNYRQGNPLLQDAVLYRGSRLPDQTQGSFSKNEMHGSLLPQVAASYTHNWEEKTAFIGAYPLDRNNTRFYADFGLEQKLNGKEVPSYSVGDAERALAPYVREMAASRKGTPERRAAEAKLEGFIKSALYESNVPTRDGAGRANRPQTLYAFRGRPNIGVRQAVALQMERIDQNYAQQAKGVMYENHRNEVGSALHRMAADQPKARFLRVMQSVAQREYGRELKAAHDDKPLGAFLDAVAKEPVSAAQRKLGSFAKVLVESMGHPDPAIRDKAEQMTERIGQLDPERASASDIVKAASSVTRGASSAQSVRQTETSKSITPKAAGSSLSSMKAPSASRGASAGFSR